MPRREFSFTGPVWQFSNGTWRFITVPEAISDDIADLVEGRTSGFGAVPVEVRIGGSRWQTSVFPSKEVAAYVLPVKKPVRVAEGLTDGTLADVTLTVLL